MVQEALELAGRIKRATPKYEVGAERLATCARFLRQEGLLPRNLNVKTDVEKEREAAVRAYRQRHREAYRLLTTLREPSAEEAAALRKMGFTFFLTVEPKSLGQVMEENPQCFRYSNIYDGLRKGVPPQSFTVAINPQELRTSESPVNVSETELIKHTRRYSKLKIETIVPNARVIMLPATGIAQADIEFQKQSGGKVLIPDFFVRSMDVNGSKIEGLGRISGGLLQEWAYRYDGEGSGYPNNWVLPAVVFVKK